MAQILVEKQVLFCGIWRPRHSMDDAFLRTVSQQFQKKPGARATWRLTREGLTVLVTQSESGRQGQTDQIPVQAIKEVVVNRYNQLCLMTLYLDPMRRFNVLVCCCHTEQDAHYMMRVFRGLPKSLSGEGYRIDLKRPQGINWTLKSKENSEDGSIAGEDVNGHSFDLSNKDSIRSNVMTDIHNHDNNGNGVLVEMEEEKLERESLEVEGRSCFNVGVQADLGPDSDLESTASDMSYQSLKSELLSLTNEVRDIKILLEQTTGISAEEFFRRQRDPNSPGLVPVKRLLSQDSDVSESGNGEKRVNFASLPAEGADDEDADFDIRSVGMQTAGRSLSKRGRYQKRVHHVLVPKKYQQPSFRSRSGSSSSMTSPSPTSPYSPYSPSSSQDGNVFSFHTQRFMDIRRDPLSRSSGHGVAGGTVVRPIESVYQMHSSGFRQGRKQLVVLPSRSASMPRHVRRSASDLEHRPVAANGAGPAVSQSPQGPPASPAENAAAS